jgi:hypothetical protein
MHKDVPLADDSLLWDLGVLRPEFDRHTPRGLTDVLENAFGGELHKLVGVESLARHSGHQPDQALSLIAHLPETREVALVRRA